MTYAPKNTIYESDIDPGVNVERDAAQYPLRHVKYTPAKFEVATSNSSGEDTFTIKYIT